MSADAAGAPTKKDRRRIRRQRLNFTREGRLYVMVTLGVGAAAVNTGNNLLFLVLGLLLSLIVLSGVLSDLVLIRLEPKRRLPARAFAGTPCLIEVELTNHKPRLPSFSIEVEDHAVGEPTDRRCYFLKVGPGTSQTASYRRVPMRRGPLQLSQMLLRTRYPFGLFEKVRTLDTHDELLVYPALIPVRAQDALSEVAWGGGTPRAGHGSEVAGLREYREGDEARAIHWRRSAAMGRLVAREREREPAARLSVVLDESRPADADEVWDASFEHAISRAASVATRALAHGVSVEIVTRAATSPVLMAGAPPDALLRFLALLQSVPAQDAPPLPTPRGSSMTITPEHGSVMRHAS